ncbi:MAG: YkgJ family cysteine cluster protein [Nitrospira sp.]|nr:MAG: Flagellin N-methylase [Nitrospira sp. OLB3]MCE7965222.1 YkgJ family cysteine cluster protein [Nitrospira sp. NTP2]MCK6491850.1 YkgJ family cysteine cluster protein [Nitrospira sp.]MEB2339999.1 YkgJ family cysteine cluster protein [Nitrospirales bacterium]QOJ35733.1 MAG: YkgJ family cysteine cluster protein [Nitrospira sp.]
MSTPASHQPVVEHFEISLQTPSGEVTTAVAVPTSFVPVASILPLLRGLDEESQRLEQQRLVEGGQAISCRKGCAACCRMLVPVSAPEAFALAEAFERLDLPERTRLQARLDLAAQRLAQAGLLKQLSSLADSQEPLNDEAIEPLNRSYYALRMPCPFLKNEACSIYEHRPAACRELAVTSPATACQDMTSPQVASVPVAVRMSTALSLLWAELTGTIPRLIPLPLAIDWAKRHEAERARRWAGTELFEKALDKVWRYLSQEKVR